MALVFPLSMPPMAATAQYFEPERVDWSSQTTNGRVGGVSAGFPLWHARWTLGPSIGRETAERWRAMVSALRGQQRTFYGADQSRPFPLRYAGGFLGLSRATGGAFDGAATSWSVNADRDVLTLSGLPTAFALSLNDYAMLRWMTEGQERRALVRTVEAAAASGGGSVSVAIEPPMPALVPGSAIADLARPVCIMRLKPETRIGEMTRLQKVDGQIAAIQDLRP